MDLKQSSLSILFLANEIYSINVHNNHMQLVKAISIHIIKNYFYNIKICITNKNIVPRPTFSIHQLANSNY